MTGFITGLFMGTYTKLKFMWKAYCVGSAGRKKKRLGMCCASNVYGS